MWPCILLLFQSLLDPAVVLRAKLHAYVRVARVTTGLLMNEVMNVYEQVLVRVSNGPSGGQNMLYGTGPVSYVDIT